MNEEQNKRREQHSPTKNPDPPQKGLQEPNVKQKNKLQIGIILFVLFVIALIVLAFTTNFFEVFQ